MKFQCQNFVKNLEHFKPSAILVQSEKKKNRSQIIFREE